MSNLTVGIIQKICQNQYDGETFRAQVLQMKFLGQFLRVVVSDGIFYCVLIAEKEMIEFFIQNVKKFNIIEVSKMEDTDIQVSQIHKIKEVKQIIPEQVQIGNANKLVRLKKNQKDSYVQGNKQEQVQQVIIPKNNGIQVQPQIQNLIPFNQPQNKNNQMSKHEEINMNNKPIQPKNQNIGSNQIYEDEIRITQISPHAITNWFFIGKVISKGKKREGQNAKGTWKVFECEVVDKNQDVITVTFWNDSCDKFMEFIQQYRVYKFPSALIKPVQPQYKKNDHDYCLSYKTDANIILMKEEEGEMNSRLMGLKFKDFQHVLKYQDIAPVDVIGICTQYDQQVALKKSKQTGNEYQMRRMTLRDHTNVEINVTLFGELADDSQFQNVKEPGFIVAFGKIKKDEYNGGVQLKNF